VKARWLEYTKRYADIMNMFPSEGRKARLHFFGKHPPENGASLHESVFGRDLSLQKEISFRRRVENMGSRAKTKTRQSSRRARMAETSRGVPTLSRVPEKRSQFTPKAKPLRDTVEIPPDAANTNFPRSGIGAARYWRYGLARANANSADPAGKTTYCFPSTSYVIAVE
jgi:hypothetical protein